MGDATQADRTALVVLGVHRSGTSAMARVLGLSGGRLPADPYPAGPDNERGFWESEAVIALDEEMLGACDSSWDDVFAGQPRHHLSNFDRVFRHKATQVLAAVFGGADPIVLKDPRINVLAAFWDAALRADGYEPVYVIMVRNPMEVAASMLARNKMPMDQGLLLWLDHMLAAERDTRQAKRLFVTYDDLLDDWRSCLDRIERVWGGSLPRRTSAAANAIEQYLAPSLRHHQAGKKALQGASPVRRMAANAYGWFKDASRSAEPLDGGALDALRGQLSSLRETIEPLLADQRSRLADYAKHAGALELLRTQMHDQLGVARDTEAILREDVARLQGSVGEGQSELEDTRRQLAEALAEAAQSPAELEARRALEAELGAVRGDLARRRQEVAQNEADLDRLRAEAVDQQRTVGDLRHALEHERASHRDEITRKEDGLEALGVEVATLRQALERAKTKAARSGAEADLEKLEVRYGVLSEELRRVQATAEDAMAKARTLAAQVKADTAIHAAQARAAEDWACERERVATEIEDLKAIQAKEVEARGAERERSAAEAKALEIRHAQELEQARSQHDRELERSRGRHAEDLAQRDQRLAEMEVALEAEADAFRNSKLEMEHELGRLRAERAQILGSTSWKLAALPRRLISGLRRS